jgi:hypothetical protein
LDWKVVRCWLQTRLEVVERCCLQEVVEELERLVKLEELMKLEEQRWEVGR